MTLETLLPPRPQEKTSGGKRRGSIEQAPAQPKTEPGKSNLTSPDAPKMSSKDTEAQVQQAKIEMLKIAYNDPALRLDKVQGNDFLMYLDELVKDRSTEERDAIYGQITGKQTGDSQNQDIRATIVQKVDWSLGRSPENQVAPAELPAETPGALSADAEPTTSGSIDLSALAAEVRRQLEEREQQPPNAPSKIDLSAITEDVRRQLDKLGQKASAGERPGTGALGEKSPLGNARLVREANIRPIEVQPENSTGSQAEGTTPQLNLEEGPVMGDTMRVETISPRDVQDVAHELATSPTAESAPPTPEFQIPMEEVDEAVRRAVEKIAANEAAGSLGAFTPEQLKLILQMKDAARGRGIPADKAAAAALNSEFQGFVDGLSIDERAKVFNFLDPKLESTVEQTMQQIAKRIEAGPAEELRGPVETEASPAGEPATERSDAAKNAVTETFQTSRFKMWGPVLRLRMAATGAHGLDRLDAKIEAKRAKVAGEEQKIAEHKSKIADITSTRDRLKERFGTLDPKAVKNFDADITAQSREQLKAEARAADLKDAVAGHDARKEAVIKKRDAIISQTETFYEAKAAPLREQRDKANAEVEQLGSEITNFQAVIDQIKTQVAGLREDAASAKYKGEKRTFEQEAKSLEADIRAFERQLTERTKTKTTKQAEYDRTNKKVTAIEATIKQFTDMRTPAAPAEETTAGAEAEASSADNERVEQRMKEIEAIRMEKAWDTDYNFEINPDGSRGKNIDELMREQGIAPDLAVDWDDDSGWDEATKKKAEFLKDWDRKRATAEVKASPTSDKETPKSNKASEGAASEKKPEASKKEKAPNPTLTDVVSRWNGLFGSRLKIKPETFAAVLKLEADSKLAPARLKSNFQRFYDLGSLQGRTLGSRSVPESYAAKQFKKDLEIFLKSVSR